MRKDIYFDRLQPEEYTDRLDANYTAYSYFQHKVEEAFGPLDNLDEEDREKFTKLFSKMKTEDMQVEVDFRGRRLAIDELEVLVSDTGVKKLVIYVEPDVW